MKRRITIEQLNELTEEQKQKLREWWKPANGDICYIKISNKTLTVCEDGKCLVTHYGFGHFDKNEYDLIYPREALPLLDIGQMIELIHELDKTPGFEGGYWLEVPNTTDYLWESVKQVLGV